MPNRKLLYLIADGARARLVRRSPETGDFVTLSEIDGRDRLRVLRGELRRGSPGRSFQSGTPERHAVGREDYFRQAKEAFAAEIAEQAADVCRQDSYEGVVIAAPARLIGALKEQVAGRATVAGAVEKDLTKAPDARLPQWFDHVAFD